MDSSGVSGGAEAKERRAEEIRGLVLVEVDTEDLRKLGQPFALRIKQSGNDEAQAGAFLIGIDQQPIASFHAAVQKLDSAEPRLLTLLTLGDNPEFLLHYALIR
jgi:hypothetical protein